ncbi:MAG: hypothetical protein J6B52_06125 [Clostridia bacterium]|nr:hypothetical protein [Clostridia bacterium]
MKYKKTFLQIFVYVEMLFFLLGYFVDLQFFLTEHPLSFSLFPLLFILILNLVIILISISIFRFYIEISIDKNIIKTCFKVSLGVLVFLIVSSSLQIIFELEKMFLVLSPLCFTVSVCTLILVSKVKSNR